MENIKFPVFSNKQVDRGPLFSNKWKRTKKIWFNFEMYWECRKSSHYENFIKEDLPLAFPQVQRDETLTGFFPIDVDFKDEFGNFAKINERPDLHNIDNCVSVAFSASKKGFHLLLYFEEMTGQPLEVYRTVYDTIIWNCGVDEEIRRVVDLPKYRNPTYTDMNTVNRGLFLASDRGITHV